MVKRFTNLFKNPSGLFIVFIIVFLLIGYIQRGNVEDAVIDINYHDTYYVTSYDNYVSIASLAFFILAFIYFVLRVAKIKLNRSLNTIHTITSFLSALFILFPFSFFPSQKIGGFPEQVENLNTEMGLMILLFIGIQILLVINIGFSIIKKRAQ